MKDKISYPYIIIFAYTILFFLTFNSTSCKQTPDDSEFSFYSEPKPGILPYFKGKSMDPYWLDNGDTPTSITDLKKLRNLSMKSHLDEGINLDSYKGKFVLMTFFYATCKGICSMITTNMRDLYNDLGNVKDLEFISITINPTEDSPEVMNKFRKRFKIEGTNWKFLNGDKNNVYSFAREELGADVSVIKGEDNLDDFVHTENIFFFDKEGYLRGVYRARGKGDLVRLMDDWKTISQ
ncbi:SCO family protein [Leptospira sp. GIMC2001]|uniref:SCO family protein n=1 Tax=Leptospira sp. GIMC2001 TaxID=1513297 RepID=UPI00234ABDFA|nr:SCO family protein [Leptospira sp. GIMC2001]WCL49969.1 SCO family protein [Leptospira sp. GIMC2001]